jgi:hypothetical protein
MAQGAVLDARAAILRLVTNQATELSVGHKTKASLPGIQFLQPILLRRGHKIKPCPCGSGESGRKRQGTGGGAEGTPAAGTPRAFRTGTACKSAMIPAHGEVKTHENPSSGNPSRRPGRPATRSEGRGTPQLLPGTRLRPPRPRAAASFFSPDPPSFNAADYAPRNAMMVWGS